MDETSDEARQICDLIESGQIDEAVKQTTNLEPRYLS